MNDRKIVVGEKTYEIKPLKMKYLKDGFYGYHKIIKETGFVKLVSKYTDSSEILEYYLKGVFDSEEIAKEIVPELDAVIMNDIITKTSILNDIQDDDEKNVD